MKHIVWDADNSENRASNEIHWKIVGLYVCHFWLNSITATAHIECIPHIFATSLDWITSNWKHRVCGVCYSQRQRSTCVHKHLCDALLGWCCALEIYWCEQRTPAFRCFLQWPQRISVSVLLLFPSISSDFASLFLPSLAVVTEFIERAHSV